MTFAANVKNAYSVNADRNLDGGDLVQTVFLIAGFAVVSILVVNWVGTSILNKGADVAVCLESVDVYGTTDAAAPGGECDETDHAADNSFTNDEGYAARY